MWVYDGEDWTDEGSSGKLEKSKPVPEPHEFEEFRPEMQIVVEVPLRRQPLPSFPSLYP